MFKKFVVSAAIACAVLTPGAQFAQAKTLRMIESWPESNKMAYMPAVQFKQNLEAQKVGLDVEITGPEAIPAFEQITPVSAGVMDLIYTYPAYHSKALTVVTNAMEPDMDKIRSSGVFEVIDRYFQENHNLKLLANVAVGSAGYHCYLREAVSENGDWAGRKIRGVSTYVPVIEALGGVAVNTDMGEVYSALERGVVDGACAPQSVFLATKHFEVAKYRTEPTFGQLVSYIAMNLDSWNDLSDEEKKAVEAASIQTEKDTIRIGNENIGNDLKTLEEAGVQVTELPGESYDKARKAYYDGVWKLAEDCCGVELAKDLRSKAIEAGLTK
ncbi:TRAP transporter substrate-binding protein DctP [Roseibium sp.]|uniref:TRAP transporter substrate-binding protein DctP n=1 Tax=Roseibium sp. TaxID=1936156 RepID=UPI003A98112C